MTVILSQQFFSGESVPVGLLTAGLTRALALHSRQGREPLRGNFILTDHRRLGVMQPELRPAAARFPTHLTPKVGCVCGPNLSSLR